MARFGAPTSNQICSFIANLQPHMAF